MPAPGYDIMRYGKGNTKRLVSEDSPEGCQISVNAVTETIVLLRVFGPNMAECPLDPQSFWKFLGIKLFFNFHLFPY